MERVMNEKGGSRFGVYIFFIILFLVIHVGLKVVPMYMDYTRMEDEMNIKAGVAQVLKDEEILRDLVNKAKDLDLPLNQESFIIQRNEERRRMQISTKAGWDVEQVFLWGAYKKTFHFAPTADQSYFSIKR